MPIVLAEASGSSAIQTALQTAFTTISSDIQTTITNMLPLALGIVGMVMVVSFGINLFRRFAN